MTTEKDGTSKVAVRLQLDTDVIDWFKAQGPDWQDRMNAVLRSFMDAHKHQP